MAWIERLSPTSEQLYDVAWVGDKVVAVGVVGTILESPDGVDWTIIPAGTSRTLTAARRVGDSLYLAGRYGAILRSSLGHPEASVSGSIEGIRRNLR